MELIEVSKQGNLYFKLSDGRFGIVYPKSGYVRVCIKGTTRSQMAKWPLRLYQINSKNKEPKDNEVSRNLIDSVADQVTLLMEFNKNNCTPKK